MLLLRAGAWRHAVPALLWLLLAPSVAAQKPQAPTAGAAGRAQVEQVVDGDTLVLVDGRHVRLIGINAPEIGRDGAADEPLAQAARKELERLVRGRDIVLVTGRESRDHYGRLLAHVQLLDGRNVQELLLAAGLGAAIAIPPNLSRQAEYQLAETQARRAGLGIWADPYYAPVAAAQLRSEHRGFRFVSGHVQKIWRSHRYVHVEIDSRLDVLIPLKDLGLFDRPPEAFAGKRVIARGWLTSYGRHFQMRVSHPAMLNLID